MNNLGFTLKNLRIAKGCTQQKLSQYISVTPKMISFYENNQRLPSIEILIKLANYFNVSVDYLLGQTTDNGKANKISTNYMDEFRKIHGELAFEIIMIIVNLSPIEKKLVLGYLNKAIDT